LSFVTHGLKRDLLLLKLPSALTDWDFTKDLGNLFMGLGFMEFDYKFWEY